MKKTKKMNKYNLLVQPLNELNMRIKLLKHTDTVKIN